METTLAILLYLQTICPCTYTQQQIDMAIVRNQQSITQIQNNQALTNQIEIDYAVPVANIVIIDPDIQ